MVDAHRSRRRTVAVAVGALAAGALSVLDAQWAAAETRQDTETVEFDIDDGVTCAIDVTSFYGDDHYGGSVTQVYRDVNAPDWRCLDSEAFVTITYTDVHGVRRRLNAVGEGGRVALYAEDIAGDYQAEHFVAFRYCRCTSPVYTTTPK